LTFSTSQDKEVESVEDEEFRRNVRDCGLPQMKVLAEQKDDGS
jgi:hypothetical protein